MARTPSPMSIATTLADGDTISVPGDKVFVAKISVGHVGTSGYETVLVNGVGAYNTSGNVLNAAAVFPPGTTIKARMLTAAQSSCSVTGFLYSLT